MQVLSGFSHLKKLNFLDVLYLQAQQTGPKYILQFNDWKNPPLTHIVHMWVIWSFQVLTLPTLKQGQIPPLFSQACYHYASFHSETQTHVKNTQVSESETQPPTIQQPKWKCCMSVNPFSFFPLRGRLLILPAAQLILPFMKFSAGTMTCTLEPV